VDLDSKERAAVADALKAIETSGLRAAGVRTRQIKGKLWEIKASQQRVFYVVVMGRRDGVAPRSEEGRPEG